jgi:mono/diheme cytochrome c family protein
MLARIPKLRSAIASIGGAAMTFALLLVAMLPASMAPAADLTRGKQLHDERCLLCHGVENYQAAGSKIKSLEGLRQMVRRWEDKLKDPFTASEREDVVTYLNATFYKFPKQRKVGLQTPRAESIERLAEAVRPRR